MICLETNRLILRDYTLKDKELYFQLKSDKQITYYMQEIKVQTLEEAEDDLTNVLADIQSKDRRFYFLHIESKLSHEQIGSVGYTVMDDTPVGKLVHAGYFIFQKYWKQGYVTEALKRVLEFAFLENNVYRVTTGCLEENCGSERVMQKCGMIKEAEHVDFEWHDGKMKTRVEYRILKNEWN